jgi:hypothetical protein
MKKAAVLLVVTAFAVTAAGALAQDSNSGPPPKPQDHFYKLNLVVQETNDAGKVTNERTFVTLVETGIGSTQSIRSDVRVPVPVEPLPAGSGANTQYEYRDAGIDFDVREVKEIGTELSLRLGVNVNGISTPQALPTGGSAHIIRQNKWDSGILIPIGKATLAYSADSEEGQGKMQVMVTATRVD